MDDALQIRLFGIALHAKSLPGLSAAELEWEVFLRSWQRYRDDWPGYPPAPGDPTMPDGRYWDRGAARVRRLMGRYELAELLGIRRDRPAFEDALTLLREQ